MSINNILYFNYGEYQFQLYKILFIEYIEILNFSFVQKFISTLKNKTLGNKFISTLKNKK